MSKFKKMLIIAGGIMVMLFMGTTVLADGNLALGKNVECSSEQLGEGVDYNPAVNICDGSTATRWSAEGYPNYVIVDLGADYSLGHTLLYPSTAQERSYQYKIWVAPSDNPDGFELVADRSENDVSASMFFNDMNAAYGQYVKLEVTGGTEAWVSIYEFEIYGTDSEVNWALGGTVKEFSEEQNSGSDVNLAANLIDGKTSTRWSAQGYPDYVVIDLGQEHCIAKFEVVPIESRKYQYKIEASIDGNTYMQLVDRTANSENNTSFTDEVTPVSARFVKLTVTGSNPKRDWISISELRIYGTYFNDARPVSNVDISVGGNTVSMSGISSALYGGSVTLIAAVFDGDKMVEMQTSEISLNKYGEAVNGSLVLTSDTSGKRIEAFIWDNDASMRSCSVAASN